MKRLSPTEFSRLQRKTADACEKLMWQLLRNRQRCHMKFRRQHALGIYTADFFCAEVRLVVEIDGSSHLAAARKRLDAIRDRWMEKQGIRVLRFTGKQVEMETKWVCAEIDRALTQGPLTPVPSPRNRGEGGNGECARGV